MIFSRPHQPPPGSELSRHQLPWMNAKPISPLSGCTGSAPCFSCSRVLNRVMLLLTLSSVSLSWRSEEHTSELQSLMRTSYAVFCLKSKTTVTLSRSDSGTPLTSHQILCHLTTHKY